MNRIDKLLELARTEEINQLDFITDVVNRIRKYLQIASQSEIHHNNFYRELKLLIDQKFANITIEGDDVIFLNPYKSNLYDLTNYSFVLPSKLTIDRIVKQNAHAQEWFVQQYYSSIVELNNYLFDQQV